MLWILLTFPTFPICFANPYKFPFFLAVSLCSIYFTLPKYLLFSFPVLTSFFFFSPSFQGSKITCLSTTQAIYFLLCFHFWLMCALKDRSEVTRITKDFSSGYLVPLMTDFLDSLTSRVESPSLDRWQTWEKSIV